MLTVSGPVVQNKLNRFQMCASACEGLCACISVCVPAQTNQMYNICLNRNISRMLSPTPPLLTVLHQVILGAKMFTTQCSFPPLGNSTYLDDHGPPPSKVRSSHVAFICVYSSSFWASSEASQVPPSHSQATSSQMV